MKEVDKPKLEVIDEGIFENKSFQTYYFKPCIKSLDFAQYMKIGLPKHLIKLGVDENFEFNEENIEKFVADCVKIHEFVLKRVENKDSSGSFEQGEENLELYFNKLTNRILENPKEHIVDHIFKEVHGTDLDTYLETKNLDKNAKKQ